MDRSEEDMKFLGFFGIFKESFKTIFSWKKIFAQITLTLILPLTIVFVANMEISHHLFWKIDNSSLFPYDSQGQRRASPTDWLYYWLFQVAYYIVLTVFSLLSTAAVVFTIASIYTGREVDYWKVMKVVRKVWKRLFVTFFYIFLALVIYIIVGEFALVISSSIVRFSIYGFILTLVILILYPLGFLYLSVVCQLASVVTVLENIHGLKTMRKGKNLAKGRKKVGMGIAFVLYGFLLGLVTVYELFVQDGKFFELALVWRVMIGILCELLLLMLFLLFIVTQTMFYLVCKSHHGEAIDKPSLSAFLRAYTGETVVYPKAGEEVQLERSQPQPPSPSQQV